MRHAPFLLPALVIVLAGTATAVGAQDYVGIGMGQNVFFSPSGQPFRSPAGQPYPTQAWISQADSDKDGRVSHEEFLADAMNFFSTLDVNHDGYINSPENTRYETQVAPEIQRTDPRIRQPRQRAGNFDPEMTTGTDPTAGRYLKQIVGASQYGLIDEPQPIRAADSNLDFRVSSDEWLAASNQRFTILDSNGDGYLTPDEMPKTPAQIAGELPADEKGTRKEKKKRSGLF